MMIKHIRHIGIPVDNVIDSIDFYRQFGFRADQTVVETWDGQKLAIAKLAIPGQKSQLELVEGGWPNHFAVQVQMDYPTSRHLIWKQKQNVTFIYDPSGNIIELVKGEV